MNQRNFLVRKLTACLVLATAMSAAAADNVLSVIPENALGFVVVNRVGDADGKVAAVAKLMDLPAPSVLSLAKLQSGAKDGIDEMGSLAVVLLPPADINPIPVPLLFVPTSNYKAFVKQFDAEDAGDGISKVRIAGSPSVVGKTGSYAVLTAAMFDARLEAALKSSKSVAKKVEPLKSFLAKGDVSVVVTTAGVKLGMQKALEGLAQAKAVLEGAGDEAKTAVAGLAVYEVLFKSMRDNVTHIGVSLRVDEDLSVHVTSQSLFASGMQDVKTPKPKNSPGQSVLAGLPGGPFMMAAGGEFPQSYMKAMVEFSVNMTKSFPGGGELTDKQLKKLTELTTDSIKGLRAMSMVMGVGKPGAPLYSNFILSINVDDSDAYMKNYTRMIGEMRKFGEETKHAFYKFGEPEKVKVGGTTGLKISMEMPNAFGKDNPQVQEMMKKMFGDDGKMTIFLAPADKNTVVGSYVSTDGLIKAMKAAKNPKSSLATDASIAKTAAMLPDDSQWVAYLSPKGTIDFVNHMFETLVPGGAPFKIPGFPKSPPIGFGASVSASKVDTDLVVPAPALKAIGSYIKTVRGGGPQLE